MQRKEGMIVAKREHTSGVASPEPNSYRRLTAGAVEAVLPGDGHDRVHPGGVAIHGNRHHGFGSGGDERFHGGRVHVPGVELDMAEDGCRPDLADGVRRRDPRQIGHDHFVAGADVERGQRDGERSCAA